MIEPEYDNETKLYVYKDFYVTTTKDGCRIVNSSLPIENSFEQIKVFTMMINSADLKVLNGCIKLSAIQIADFYITEKNMLDFNGISLKNYYEILGFEKTFDYLYPIFRRPGNEIKVRWKDFEKEVKIEINGIKVFNERMEYIMSLHPYYIKLLELVENINSNNDDKNKNYQYLFPICSSPYWQLDKNFMYELIKNNLI